MPVEEYSFGPDEEKRVSFEYSDPLSTGVVRVDGLVVLEFAALSELIEGRARQLSKEVEIELCAFEKSKAYQIGPPSYGILIKANGVLLAGSTYHVSNRNRWFSQTLFILGVFVVMPLLSKCVEHGLEEALNAEKKALLISGIGTLVCVNGAKNGSRAIGLVGALFASFVLACLPFVVLGAKWFYLIPACVVGILVIWGLHPPGRESVDEKALADKVRGVTLTPIGEQYRATSPK